MTNEPTHNDSILMLTLGEMRMIGLRVPEPFEDDPDDVTLAIGRAAARTLAGKLLSAWRVPDAEASDFLQDASDAVLSDVLVIHQLLQVMFTRNTPGDFIQSANKAYDGRTAWDVIHSGDSSTVRQDLAYQVFGGGW